MKEPTTQDTKPQSAPAPATAFTPLPLAENGWRSQYDISSSQASFDVNKLCIPPAYPYTLFGRNLLTTHWEGELEARLGALSQIIDMHLTRTHGVYIACLFTLHRRLAQFYPYKRLPCSCYDVIKCVERHFTRDRLGVVQTLLTPKIHSPWGGNLYNS